MDDGRISKGDIRGLHGRDAEILEFDEDDQPTGRSFRVVPPPGPLANWTSGQRFALRAFTVGLGVPLVLIFAVITAIGIGFVWVFGSGLVGALTAH